MNRRVDIRKRLLFIILFAEAASSTVAHNIKRNINANNNSDDHEWGYSQNNGPKKWPSLFSACEGDRQSPMHLRLYQANAVLGQPITLYNDRTGDDVWTITNNGHTVMVSVPEGYSVAGGLLPGSFIIEQFHFHWGAENDRGSEHVIDFAQYPMEMHLVARNEEYASVQAALGKENGVSVFSFLFQVHNRDNIELAQIVDKFPEVKHKGESTAFTGFDLTSLIAPVLHKLLRYQGSLTTPACDEQVTWSVFWSTLRISNQQMNAFRGLEGFARGPLVDNFRPPQPHNSRKTLAIFTDKDHWLQY